MTFCLAAFTVSLNGQDRPAASVVPLEPYACTGIVNDSGVRLRSLPTLDGTIVGTLTKDESVTITEKTVRPFQVRNMSSYWYRVETAAGAKGFCYGYFVDIDAVPEGEKDIIIKDLNASSYLADRTYVFRHHPGKAFDHDPLSAWTEGAPGAGINEWVEAGFDRVVEISGLEIRTGGGDKKTFKSFNRVKKIDILFDGKPFSFTLEDTAKEQSFTLPQPVKARRCRLIIKDVYKGTRGDQTRLSEISFSISGKYNLRTVKSFIARPGGMCFVRWIPVPASSRYYLFEDGTCVYTSSGIMEPRMQSVDKRIGTWILKSNRTVEIQIKTYVHLKGRGKSAGTDSYVPYYEDYEYVAEAMTQADRNSYDLNIDWESFGDVLLGWAGGNGGSYACAIAPDEYGLRGRSLTPEIGKLIAELKAEYTKAAESQGK